MNPNTPIRHTKTNSLHIAALHGHEPIVQYFIERAKLNPNSGDENNNIPFHLAAKHNHLHIIRLLNDKKCSQRVFNSKNELPLRGND